MLVEVGWGLQASVSRYEVRKQEKLLPTFTGEETRHRAPGGLSRSGVWP